MRTTLFIVLLLGVVAVGCTSQKVVTPSSPALPPVTVVKNDAGESIVEFSVPGLHCEDCAGRCETVLTEQPGVESVEFDLDSKTAVAKVAEDSFEGEETLLALREKFPESLPATAE